MVLQQIYLSWNKKFRKLAFAQSESGLMRFPEEKHLVKAYIIQASGEVMRGVHAFIRHTKEQTRDSPQSALTLYLSPTQTIPKYFGTRAKYASPACYLNLSLNFNALNSL